MTELQPDWPCVAMDIGNAHNEVSRSKVIRLMEGVPSLQHLAQHMATVLASSHRLESSGEAWGEAPEGGCQGDPEAGGEFCVSVHEPRYFQHCRNLYYCISGLAARNTIVQELG